MGVKKNFFYSSIVTVSNFLFPLITYPYVSRVLGVANIGTVNYIDSIINYFSLFSMMGIAVLGVREIASARESKEKLSSAFFSLLALNAGTVFVALLVLLFIAFFSSSFSEHRHLLLIGGVKLLGMVFLVDWFYKGIENFKYISIRTIFVKTMYVLSVFLLVKEKNDYEIYFALSALMFFVNALYNLFYIRKFVSLRNVVLDVKRYVKPFFSMGGYFILTSMYTTFNVAFLGYTTSATEVGYYTTATKLFSLVLAFYTAFTGVMLPKMSYLFECGDYASFERNILKSVDLLFLCMLPIASYGIAYAPEIILLLAGPGYEGAVFPFGALMTLLFFVGVDQIQVSQILIAMKLDKAVLRCSMIAAVVGLLLNVILVPKYSSMGSTCVLFASEMAIMFCAFFFVRKKISITLPKSNVVKALFTFLITTFSLFVFKQYIHNVFLSMVLGFLLLVVLTFVLQLLFVKNKLFLELLKKRG